MAESLPPCVRQANEADRAVIFEMVNAAYAIESGDSEVAFKNGDRLLDPAELPIERYLVMSGASATATSSPSTGPFGSDDIVACVCVDLPDNSTPAPLSDSAGDAASTSPASSIAHIGPLAVKPGSQGSGLGSKMVAAAEGWAAAHGATVMELEIVDKRTDLPKFYLKMGYRVTGERPFDGVAVLLTCPVHFIVFQKDLV